MTTPRQIANAQLAAYAARSLVGFVALLASVSCDARVIESAGHTVAPEQRSGLKTCSYVLSFEPDSSYSDLLDLLGTRQYDVCDWIGPTQLSIRHEVSEDAECGLPPATGYTNQPDSPLRRCSSPEWGRPENGGEELQAFCHRSETAYGHPVSLDEQLGLATMLFHAFGLPVQRYFVTRDGPMLWADFDEYLWPDTFAADAKAAAAKASMALDIQACADSRL